MQRRTALTLLTGGIVAPPLAEVATRPGQLPTHAAPAPEASGGLLFFSDAEHALLDRLTDMIIPADERSGGAHDAKVAAYIDFETAHSPIATQDFWRDSLKLVEEDAARRFGKPFLQCDAASQVSLMTEWARNEADPKTPLERFFVRLKHATTFAYYTTEIGLLKELGYKGNDVCDEFPGACTDPNCKFCNQ